MKRAKSKLQKVVQRVWNYWNINFQNYWTSGYEVMGVYSHDAIFFLVPILWA